MTNEQELKKLKNAELKKMCKELGLLVSGNKKALVDRILKRYSLDRRAQELRDGSKPCTPEDFALRALMLGVYQDSNGELNMPHNYCEQDYWDCDDEWFGPGPAALRD